MTLLRGYINLQAGANRPVACAIPCVRFNRAVSPPVNRSFRERVCSCGFLRIASMGYLTQLQHSVVSTG